MNAWILASIKWKAEKIEAFFDNTEIHP